LIIPYVKKRILQINFCLLGIAFIFFIYYEPPLKNNKLSIKLHAHYFSLFRCS
ncbi:Hypothetical protein FKW44_009307, partial [Caligus rogercresseyi]